MRVFSLLGWVLLLFVMLSNYFEPPLSTSIVIILCVLSDIFLCAGVLETKMNCKKLYSLIFRLCGIITGIIIIVVSIMDRDIPKPLWVLFLISCLINSVLIIMNTKKKGK